MNNIDTNKQVILFALTVLVCMMLIYLVNKNTNLESYIFKKENIEMPVHTTFTCTII